MTPIFAYFSCEFLHGSGRAGKYIAAARAKHIISEADTPYIGDYQDSLYGFSTTWPSPMWSQAATVEPLHHQQFWAKPGMSDVLGARSSSVRVLRMIDDHERAGNDWDGSIQKANEGDNTINCTTQAQVNTYWADSQTAWINHTIAAGFDNTVFDRASNTELPEQSVLEGQTPLTTNYPIIYWHETYDAAGNLGAADSGDAILALYPDNISYRSHSQDDETASKHCWRPQQEAYFLDKLDRLRRPWVLIFSTKKWFRSIGNTQNNPDTIGAFITFRNRMLAAFTSLGVNPIILSGDQHRPHIIDCRTALGGPGNVIDICACPSGVAITDTGLTTDTAGARCIWMRTEQVYGLVGMDNGMLRVQVRSARNNGVLWTARFAPYSNVPVYDAATVITRLGA